jgi:hypothetical protein
VHPPRVIKPRFVYPTGQAGADSTANRLIDYTGITIVTPDEAWGELVAAVKEKDVDERGIVF